MSVVARLLPVVCLVALVAAPFAVADEGPPGLIGFSGQVRGVVVEKGDGFFTFKVARLLQTWKGSEAKEPQAIVGKTVRVGPRWEKTDAGWRAVERHAAFIRKLEAGEEITLEIRYSEAGRFALLELSEEQRKRADGERTGATAESKPEPKPEPRAEPGRPALPEGVAGFVGRVRGRVLEKLDGDVVLFEIGKVTRVWKGNAATNLEAMEKLRVRVGPAWVKGDDGKARRNEGHVRFVRSLAEREDLEIEIRHGEGDYFPILELTAAQRERRAGEEGK